MECFRNQLANKPTKTEINIFHQVKALFDNINQEQMDIYASFLESRDPLEREALARKIQSLEEDIIYQVAREYNLSFGVVAGIVCKVDYFLDLA